MNEKIVIEEVSKTYEGKMYLQFRQCNGQKMKPLEIAVRDLIAENNLTATQAKGFLEFMKLIIDECSYLPKQK